MVWLLVRLLLVVEISLLTPAEILMMEMVMVHGSQAQVKPLMLAERYWRM